MADLIKDLKVLKVGGVSYNTGWSKNDFTDELKSKLEGIEAGAQVNVIEKIMLNGQEVSVSSKSVDLGNLQKTLTAGTKKDPKGSKIIELSRGPGLPTNRQASCLLLSQVLSLDHKPTQGVSEAELSASAIALQQPQVQESRGSAPSAASQAHWALSDHQCLRN